MRVYLAGPMSNIPQFNFPLFYKVAAELRERGWDVVSPAELDDQEDKGAAMSSPDGDPNNRDHMGGKTWADFLARDVKLIADKVQGIVFLQDWWRSRGARLEAFVGLLQKNFSFFQYETDGSVIRLERESVARKIFDGIGDAKWADVYTQQAVAS
ncbi:MAG TPA: DUF4406 domain-containing protein [Acidobacteriaceae bacterium]|nr:DUF4406 domain-containing protein [Acidobacteriaceae bacterium]